MSERRSTAALLLGFAVLNAVAVVWLGAVFDWPAVLDEPAAVALPKFAEAQSAIMGGFLLQTLLSVAMVPIAIGLHIHSGGGFRLWPVTVAALGILSGLTQTLGWIRWPIAVPDLADTWLAAGTTPEVRAATEVSYDLLNSYAGGALGEYMGWLFQALWAIGIAALLLRSRVVGPALGLLGVGLTVIWGLSFLAGPFNTALADGLFDTAGFTAYGLWFLWLGAIGLVLLRPVRTAEMARVEMAR